MLFRSDDVGLGVLFGLNNYQYDFIGILMHAEHLEAYKGVGPHTISVPRLRRADDIDPDVFDNGISDEMFAKIVSRRNSAKKSQSREASWMRITWREPSGSGNIRVRRNVKS